MTRCLVLAIGCGVIPAIAAAQSADPPEPPRLPAISVSVAAGPMQHAGEYSPIVLAGAQFSVGRLIRFEVEAGHSVGSGRSIEIPPGRFADVDERRVFITGVNLLFRAGTRRVAGFAGGGVGAHRINARVDEVGLFGVPTGRTITVTDTRLGMQIVGGADVRLTGRLDGFAAIRGELLPDANIGVTAGVRATIKTKPAAPAERLTPGGARAAVPDGQQVRVTMRAGDKRSGWLVSLSPSELVITRGGTREQVPLADVRRIETVSHHARTGFLIGLLGGAGFALAVCLADDNFCGDDAPFGVVALVYGGIGAGIGAGVGAMANAATADRHVVFESQLPPAAQIVPILGKGRAGAVVKLRWKTP